MKITIKKSFFPFFIFFLISTLLLPHTGRTQEVLPTPESHFGFIPGSDRNLFDYEALISYLQKLDQASDMMEMRKIGTSPQGRDMYLAFISSPANISQLDELKDINRELALNPNLNEERQRELVTKGKVFFLFTLSMHSTEVGPAQAAPSIAYELLTTQDENIKKSLNDVVYMMVPNHNPDGMDMIVHHYNKYKGTKYEGSSMPGLYHKYIGHDNNRDFVTLSQSDTKAIAAIYNTDWFPQVMVEKHQMGSTGPRYFVSPPHDPIAENIDAGLWNWIKIFGSRAVTQMTDEGLKGVSHNYLFDDYWPGATETCIWKGVIGMLTECASVKLATPVYIEPNELRASGKGMGEYEKSINMVDPWPGGYWRLSNIVEYERVSTLSYLQTAAIHKDEILLFRNNLTKKEVEKGRNEAPYYYIMPLDQHDPSELVDLVNLMHEHGVEVYALDQPLIVNNKKYASGDIVIPLAQPYRAFIKEVMENQKFPERHYTPGGEMIRPYDITSWSLPLHKGVKAVCIDQKIPEKEIKYKALNFPFRLDKQIPEDFKGIALSANENGSFKLAFEAMQKDIPVYRTTKNQKFNGTDYPAGSFIIEKKKDVEALLKIKKTASAYLQELPKNGMKELRLPQIALVESWFHDMDAGWTRFVLDSYHIPFKLLRPADIKTTDLSQFDVIIFPDENKAVLLQGKYGYGNSYYVSQYPPEYAKGMGKEGLEKVLTFANEGGKVISWRSSIDLFTGSLSIGEKEKKEEFSLPITDRSSNYRKQGLDIAGSFLQIQLKPNHPLTYGMPEYSGVFHRSSPVLATSIPYFDMDRRVIARFSGENILLSGFAENEELLENQPAMVWVKKGQGQFVFFSFNPQFRASTPASYKLLFNALLLE